MPLNLPFFRKYPGSDEPRSKKAKKPPSIQRSIASLVMGIVGTVFVIVMGASAYISADHNVQVLTERVNLSLNLIEHRLVAAIEEKDSARIAATIMGLEADDDFLSAALADEQGRIIQQFRVNSSQTHVEPSVFTDFLTRDNTEAHENSVYSLLTRPYHVKVMKLAGASESGTVIGYLAVKYSSKRAANLAAKEISLFAAMIPLILVMLGGLLLIALRKYLKPLRDINHTTEHLASGNLEVTIPHQERADEIGEMARTIQVFKENLCDRAQLQGEMGLARNRSEARQLHIDELIADFRVTVGGGLKQVTDNSQQMTMAANMLSSIAAQSSHRAHTVSEAVVESSRNVLMVARASEELSVSISEIEQQVLRTRNIVNDAARTTASTTSTMGDLAARAQDIGEIIGLIQAIARQTNLLALNATIEAARAGEAGRGFAVVAQEVKSLAAQTGKATERIAEHVTSIQSATTTAVEAIDSIAGTMKQAEGFAAGIAVAVERQVSAIGEISHSVTQAEQGTQVAASNMNALASAVGETDQSAMQVHCAASEVSDQASHLNETVDLFLKKVALA